MKINKMPNFLIVGAAKSGTSSLHEYLIQHEDIFMPTINKEGRSVKEPQFLIKEKLMDRLHFGIWDWNEYQSLFNDVKEESCIGEASVFYLYYYKQAIKNIKYRLGESTKIIIILRNPIHRAYSAFNHVSRSGVENLSFKDSLDQEDSRLEKDVTLTPMVMYKDMGLYYSMVKAYKEEFKDVHVILFDDFKENTDKVMRDVFKFLDVKTEIKINSTVQHNVGGKKWKNQWLRKLFYNRSFFKIVYQKIIPKKVKLMIQEKLVFLSTNPIKPMSKEVHNDLLLFFREDIKKLSQLLEINLEKWMK